VPTTYLGNIAKVRLRGIEIESNWQAADWLQVHVAAAVTGAKYIDYKNAGATVDFGYTGGPKTSDLSGLDIPNVSPWSINAGVNFDKPIGQIQGQDVALFGFVNEAVTGKTRYTDAGSTIWLGQKTYGLTNASIGIRRLDDRLSVSAWVKNLFDVKYTNNKTLGSTNTAPTWLSGDPRTFGATVSVRL
jgi:iron complex outermembrane receptor protein